MTPKSWQRAPLGDLCEFINGDRGKNYPSRSSFVSTGIPFVNAGHLRNGKIDFSEMNYISEDRFDLLGSGKVRAGDILFCLRGSLGKTAHAANIRRAAIASSLVILRPSERANAKFIYYVLEGPLGTAMVRELDSGSAQPNLSAKSLQAYRVPLPPLSEQQKIAAILSSVDETIEKTEAVIEQLGVVKKAMMQELLTRGLPGRHTRFKKTEIGEVPEEWEVVELSSVATVQTGIAKGKKADDNAQEVPYLRVANVQDGYLDLDEMKTIRVDSKALVRYQLQPGDVLFTEGGDADKLGRGCVWPGGIEPCLHQNHVFAVRPQRETLLPQFLSYFGASAAGKTYFLDAAKQTTNLASINSTQLKAMPVPVPPLEEQQAIVQHLRSVDATIEAERSALERLQSAKSALMSVLLTGELRVQAEPGNDAPLSPAAAP